MLYSFIKYVLAVFFLSPFYFVLGQHPVTSKDIVNMLYKQHTISFELKNNKKKGQVFVDYLSDENYQYEIALLDRKPVRVIDSEDILKITVSDTNRRVYQNSFDTGINDTQDFDKNMIKEFSKVILVQKAQSIKPIYSFAELQRKVYELQNEKRNKSLSN